MDQPATLAQVRRWPALVGVDQAARALGISHTTAYDSIRAGTFPVPVVKVGSRMRIRTADLVRYLEADGGASS